MDKNFDLLPNEIIIEIFKYLSVYDQNEARLTCLRFNAILQLPLFVNQIELYFNNIQFSSSNPAIISLLSSKRRYSNISFKRIKFYHEKDSNFDYYYEDDSDDDYEDKYVENNSVYDDSQFWIRFGSDIKSLKIEQCSFFNIKQLVSIFKQLPNLEILSIIRVSIHDGNFYKDNYNGEELDTLKGCLDNVTKFEVFCWCSATNTLVNKLKDFLPNVKDFTVFAFYDTPPVDEDIFFEYYSKYLIHQSKKLHSLNFQDWTVEDFDQNIYLTDIKDLDFINLSIEIFITNNKKEKLLCNFFTTQKRLKSLKLCSDQFFDTEIITICNNLNYLIEFELKNSRVTEIGIAELYKLNNLESLKLKFLIRDPIMNGMKKNMEKFKNDKLKKLSICLYSIKENDENYTFFKELTENYKNLTELQLDVNETHDFMFQIIIKNLKLLRTLNLNKCSGVTDYGITGVPDNNIEKKTNGLSISNLKGLKYLYIEEIEKISINSFVEIAKCNELQNLSLTKSNINIDPKQLNIILRKFTSLRFLKIFNCHESMLNDISIIIENIPRLKDYKIK